MAKTASKIQPLCIKTGALSILFTLGPACGFLSNDLGGNHGSAPTAAYDASLDAGNSANALLSDDQFKSLAVEIQYMPGAAPSQEALNQLQNFLVARLNKPGGVFIQAPEQIPAGQQAAYTVSDVRAIESRYRRTYTQKDRVAAYFLFLDGHSNDDQDLRKVLGQAYRNTSIAIFENTIHDLSGRQAQPATWVLEATIMQHEFGHVLGLVNNGSPMESPHLSSASISHCDRDCLMNSDVETSVYLSKLMSGTVPGLDSMCLADLKANGGK